MCNLSVFGLVCGKFPESFAYAQTVDTRPLFPPTTWPGYEANTTPEHARKLKVLEGSKLMMSSQSNISAHTADAPNSYPYLPALQVICTVTLNHLLSHGTTLHA